MASTADGRHSDEIAHRTRRRLKPAEREQQLLAVAEELFAERGMAVTMEEIAHHAGVTKPVLYRHFASKDLLIAACVANAREELFRLTSDAAVGATSTEHALWLTLHTFFTFISSRARAWALLSAQGALRESPASAEIQAMRRSQSVITATLLSETLPDLEPGRARLFVEAVDGAAERVAVWLRDEPDVDLDQVTDDLFEALWLGGRGLMAGQRWRRTWM